MAENPMLLHVQGVQYATRGEHLEAIGIFSIAIEMSPFWLAPYIHWSRGESYAALQRYEEAVADYEVPHCDDVCEEEEFRRRWRLLALLREQGQLERATRAVQDLVSYCTNRIERLIQLGCYPWDCYYERARAHAELKDLTAAKSDCALASQALAAARARTHRLLQTHWKPDEADISRLLEAILGAADGPTPSLDS